MTNKEKIITLLADIKNVDAIIEPILDDLRELSVDKKIIYRIHISLEEILVNVASYAYPKDEKGMMSASYIIKDNPRMIIITIKDKGIPFDPLKDAKEPDLDASVEERRVGGLGIFIAKNTMDEITHERINDENVLIIKKEI